MSSKASFGSGVREPTKVIPGHKHIEGGWRAKNAKIHSYSVIICGAHCLVYKEVIKVCCIRTGSKREAVKEIISRKLNSVIKFNLLLLLHKKP